MTKTLLTLLTLSLCSANAQVIYQHDFESAIPKAGERIQILNTTDAKMVPVASSKETAAAKPEGANSALIIQGGAGEPHQWQPAGDIALPNLKDGYLYIGFMLKNASFDASLFGIQIADNDKKGRYALWQRMRMYPTHISLTGTGRGLGKEELSSGKDAKWMKIEWIMPTPGNTTGVPRLIMNGNDQGAIILEPIQKDVAHINSLRLWLPGRKGEDTKFLVDDLLVASASTLEELAALVKKSQKPTLP